MTGSCALGISTPFQLTTLNVMGAAYELFDVSMGIQHGKFTSGNVGDTHQLQFPMINGSFTALKILKVPVLPPPMYYTISDSNSSNLMTEKSYFREKVYILVNTC